MLGKLVTPKYSDPGSLVVDVSINGQSIKNALIDLGATINVMTKDTMKNLKIEGLRDPLAIMQLAESSTVTPNEMIENIVVTLDSLEYLADFMILSPKVNLFGYPIMLCWPWLATIDVIINCRLGNMTISNGQAKKKIDLYPLAQLLPDLSTSIWLDLGDEEEELNSILQLMMLHRQSFLKLQEEDSIL